MGVSIVAIIIAAVLVFFLIGIGIAFAVFLSGKKNNRDQD